MNFLPIILTTFAILFTTSLDIKAQTQEILAHARLINTNDEAISVDINKNDLLQSFRSQYGYTYQVLAIYDVELRPTKSASIKTLSHGWLVRVNKNSEVKIVFKCRCLNKDFYAKTDGIYGPAGATSQLNTYNSQEQLWKDLQIERGEIAERTATIELKDYPNCEVLQNTIKEACEEILGFYRIRVPKNNMTIEGLRLSSDCSQVELEYIDGVNRYFELRVRALMIDIYTDNNRYFLKMTGRISAKSEDHLFILQDIVDD